MQQFYGIKPLRRLEKLLREIAHYIDYSAVSHARKRLRDRINKDKKVRRRFEYIAASLS